jgi:serine/threonine protein kinase
MDYGSALVVLVIWHLRFFRKGSKFINAFREYSISVDIWSFGIMAYSLIYGKLPFQAKSKEEYWHSILTL